MRFIVFGVALTATLFFQYGTANALRVVDREYVFDKLEDFQSCQNEAYEGQYCLDALNRWLEDNPKDSFEAAKMVRSNMKHWIAVPYFARIEEKSEGFCDDTDLRLAVVSALSLSKDKHTNIVAQAEDLTRQCFASLKSVVQDEFSDTNVFSNTCKIYLKEGLLKGLRQKKCEALK